MTKKKLFAELVMLWLIPLTLLLSYGVWQQVLPNHNPVVWYHLLVPAVAMTLVVSLGAGVYRMWWFDARFTVRGVVPQIGLIYAAVFQPIVLTNTTLLISNTGLSFGLYPLVTAGLGMLSGVVYDLVVVHYGILRLRTPAFRNGASTLRIVSDYGFAFFGTVGLLIGLSSKWGYYLIQHSELPLGLIYAVGITVIAFPVASYLTMKQRSRGKQPRATARSSGARIKTS